MEKIGKFATLKLPEKSVKSLVTISAEDWNSEKDTKEIECYGVIYFAESEWLIAEKISHKNLELQKMTRISLRNDSKQYYFIQKSDSVRVELLRQANKNEELINCYDFDGKKNQLITIISTPIPIRVDNIFLES